MDSHYDESMYKRYDDGEFMLLVDGVAVGDILTNGQARTVLRQLKEETFELSHYLAGVVER